MMVVFSGILSPLIKTKKKKKRCQSSEKIFCICAGVNASSECYGETAPLHSPLVHAISTHILCAGSFRFHKIMLIFPSNRL